MPVHRVKGGYRWGKHGKVYPTKAAAEKQARAIYASGYRGDASEAAAKRALAAEMRQTRGAELRYVQGLTAIMRGIHKVFLDYFRPRLAQVAKGPPQSWGSDRQDTTRTQLDLGPIIVHVAKQIPAHVAPAFGTMAKSVNASASKTMATLVGIHPQETGIAAHIAAARDENIRLVENAMRVYAQDVRDVFDDPDSFALRPEELEAKLVARGQVSESRAQLIARDQTLKLHGDIIRIRQVNAGVEEYEWNTSNDDRVRESHENKEGQRFRWDSPPADTGHPGQDFQCRCVPIPIIPELEDAEEPEEETPEAEEPEAPAAPPLPLDELDLPEEPEAKAAAQDVLSDVAQYPIVHQVLDKLPMQGPVVLKDRVEWMGEPQAGFYSPGLGLHLGVSHDPSNYNHTESFGKLFDIAARAKTLREFNAKTFMHEFGHHIHRSVRDALDASTAARVNDTVIAAYGSRPKVPFTAYADASAGEYFAESFSAYVHHHDEFKAYDPSGHKMVEDVLRLRRIRR